MRRITSIPKLFHVFLVGSLLFVVSGCAHIQLVSEYDEVIDQGITALMKKTDNHLSILERNMARMELLKDGTKEKEELKKEVSYEASEGFYREFKVDLHVLKLRASSYAKNDLTVKQMDALEGILDEQEGIHKRGFQTVEDVSDMQNAFDRGFRGILKLEIAKKRGK